MFKQITTLGGNEIYLIISLLIFIAFFIGVGIRLVFMKKDYADYMNNIPLDGQKPDTNPEIEQQKSL